MAKVSSNILKETDLIQDHRKLMESYLKKETNWTLTQRREVLKRFDNQIHKGNFRKYINRHVKILAIALAQNQLEAIAKY